jgi:hypothetical protein
LPEVVDLLITALYFVLEIVCVTFRYMGLLKFCTSQSSTKLFRYLYFYEVSSFKTLFTVDRVHAL